MMKKPTVPYGIAILARSRTRRIATGLLIALAAIGAGCGASQRTVTTTVTAREETSNTTSSATSGVVHHGASHLNNPAQQPDFHTTISCDHVEVGHACVSETTAPSNPNQFRQRNCDTNIVANSAVSCSFAENMFYEYYESSQTETAATGRSLRVHSPTTGKDYSLFCSARGSLIACTGEPLSTGIYISFPNAAIAAYTPAQAAAYASSHDVGHPTPVTPSSGNEATPSAAPNSSNEASSEEDQVGSYSHAGDGAFCEEHECIGDFEGESGYVVKCADGAYSHAGGISGACSHHGGES